MMIPGRTLHRVAHNVCSKKTLERVVEPAIADLQKEYRAAGAAPFARRAWILLAGYVAILKVITICAATVSVETHAERQALLKTVAWCTAMVAVIVFLLMLPPFFNHPRMSWQVAMMLVPQAVPLAIPIGIAFGLAFGLTARPAMALAKAALFGAVAASTLSLVILVWGLPAANHAFRELAFRELRARGYEGPAPTSFQKSYKEMTLSELRDVIAHFSADGEPRTARRYAFGFHQRFSLAAATIALVSMLLVVRADTRVARGVFAFAACVIYWVLMFGGEWGTHRGYLIPALGAWLPNLVLVACAIVIASRSSRLRGSLSPAR